MSIEIMVVDNDPSSISQKYFDEENNIRYYENDDSKKIINPAIEKIVNALNKMLYEALDKQYKFVKKNGRQVEDDIYESHYTKFVISGENVNKDEERIWEMVVMFQSKVSTIIHPVEYAIDENLTENIEDQEIVSKHIITFMRNNKTQEIKRQFTVKVNNRQLRIGGDWGRAGICDIEEIEHDPIEGRLSAIDIINGTFKINGENKTYTINFKTDSCSEIKNLMNGCGITLFKIYVYAVVINQVIPKQLHYIKFKSI